MRQAAYLALRPLDHVSRVINGKRELPPLDLRRHVGPLHSFEASGAEFRTYLRLLVGLAPDESILDIGCGCGLMALALKDYAGDAGRYVGVDIHKRSINWCRRHIQTSYPKFEFLHIDRTPIDAESELRFELPFPDRSFDVILLKSVFTHLRPPEVDLYLREVTRLLSNRGRCLATFFLLNPRQNELEQRGLNEIAFDYGDESFRYAYRNSPESAVAFSESFVMNSLSKHELSLRQPVLYGTWSGLPDGLSFQDMLVIERSEP